MISEALLRRCKKKAARQRANRLTLYAELDQLTIPAIAALLPNYRIEKLGNSYTVHTSYKRKGVRIANIITYLRHRRDVHVIANAYEGPRVKKQNQ